MGTNTLLFFVQDVHEQNDSSLINEALTQVIFLLINFFYDIYDIYISFHGDCKEWDGYFNICKAFDEVWHFLLFKLQQNDKTLN